MEIIDGTTRPPGEVDLNNPRRGAASASPAIVLPTGVALDSKMEKKVNVKKKKMKNKQKKKKKKWKLPRPASIRRRVRYVFIWYART